MALTRPGADAVFRAELVRKLNTFEETVRKNRVELVEAERMSHEQVSSPLDPSTIAWLASIKRDGVGPTRTAAQRIRQLGFEIDPEDEDKLGDFLDKLVEELTEAPPLAFPSVPAANEGLSLFMERDSATPTVSDVSGPHPQAYAGLP